MVLGLHALVLACMDEMAFERCTQALLDGSNLQQLVAGMDKLQTYELLYANNIFWV